MSIYETAQASTGKQAGMRHREGPGARPSVFKVATSCLFGALLGTSLADDQLQYAIKDVRGIEVRLEMPWTTLMLGERIPYEFILSNATDKPIPVAIPLKKYEFGWPLGGQPYLDPEWKSGYEKPPLEFRTAKWPPQGLDEGMGHPGIEAWGTLEPGYRLVWNQSRLAGDYFGALAYAGLQSLTARWLAGPQTWISSETVPLKIVSVPMSQRREVFSGQWSSYGYGKDSRNGTAFVAPIEDRLFLFWVRSRITEVSPDDQFEHQIDEDGTNLEITIRGKAGTRKVYYHLRHGLTRDTPWPIGPVKLFYPKPEPIPPAELDALRKTSFQSEDSSTADANPRESANGEVSKNNRPSNTGNDVKEMRPWFLAGMSVLLVLIILAAAWIIHRRVSK